MRNQDQNYQNGPSTEDDQISHLLASLPRVDAPGDFGFRLKARIAAATHSTGRRSWLPASAAVAAPLGLVLAVGGYFALTTMYSPSTVNAPQIVELKPAQLPAEEFVDSSPQPAPTYYTGGLSSNRIEYPEIVVNPPEIDRGIVSRPIKNTGSLRRTNDNGGGGSVDQALGGNGKEVLPKAVIGNQSIQPETIGNTPRSAKAVLSSMGIDAAYAGSSWTVVGITKGSAADRSGLKAGDVIETVNGRPMTGTTSFDSKFTGRAVRVRREGKSIQIDLKH